MSSPEFGRGLCVFCDRAKAQCPCSKMSSVALSVRASINRDKIDDCTAALLQMGFDCDRARRAAELTVGNLEQASDLILAHSHSRAKRSKQKPQPQPPPVPPRPPQQPAASSTSSPVAPSSPALSSYVPSPTRGASHSMPSHSPSPSPPSPVPSSASSSLPEHRPLPYVASTSSHYSVAHNISRSAHIPRSSLHSLPCTTSTQAAISRTAPVAMAMSPGASPSTSMTTSPRQTVSVSPSSSSSSSSSSTPKHKVARAAYQFTAPDVFSRVSPPSMAVVDDDREPSLMSLDSAEAEVRLVLRQPQQPLQPPPQQPPHAVPVIDDGVRIHVDDHSPVRSRFLRDALHDESRMDAIVRATSPTVERISRSSTPSSTRSSLIAGTSVLLHDAAPYAPLPHSPPQPTPFPGAPTVSPFASLPPPASVAALSTSDQFYQLALWLHPHEFRPNFSVDSQDSQGKWLAAFLLHVHTDYTPSTPHLTTFCNGRVHYDGWAARWDEDVDLLRQPHRIAQPATFSRPGRGWRPEPWAQVDALVVVWLPKGTGKVPLRGAWLDGEVVRVDGHQVLVRCFAAAGEKDRKAARWYNTESDLIVSRDAFLRRQEEAREAQRREQRELQRRAHDEIQRRRQEDIEAQLQTYRQRMEQEAERERRLRQTPSTSIYSDPLPSASLSYYDRTTPSPPSAVSPPVSAKREPGREVARSLLSSYAQSTLPSPTLTPSASRRSSSFSSPPSSPPVGPPCPYWVGQFVEVEDTVGKWLPAEVLQLSPSRCELFIRYENWGPEWNEWLDVASLRIRPLGSTLEDTAEEQQRKRHEQAFRVLLARIPYQLVQEERDGNCLFRAVARQLWGDAALHRRVRRECCDWIEREGDFFRSFVGEDIAEYVKAKRRPEEWGDHVEIEAMKELYDVNVLVFDKRALPDEAKRLRAEPGAEGAGEQLELDVKGDLLDGVTHTIRLSYHGRNHYNSLIDPEHPPPLMRLDAAPAALDGKWKARRVERERLAALGKVDGEEMKDERQAKAEHASDRVLHHQQLILMGDAAYVP